MIFETERLTARLMTEDDAALLQRIFSDEEAMRHYPSTKDEAETQRWIQWTLGCYASHGVGLWIFETKDSGEFVGQAGIVPQRIEDRDEMEIGYLFVRKHWGKGYASEAAASCRDYGIREKGIRRFVSIIRPENERSVAVAKRIGMHFERTVDFHGSAHALYAMSC